MKDASPEMLSLFHRALEHPAADRAAYLDAACGPDAALRDRIEALLRAHERAGGFLPEKAATADGLATTADDGPAGQPGAVLDGRYRLLQVIGEGGMGTVWLAEQTDPVQRRVAVKLIKPGMDSRAVLARFEAERQALALMDHPNIAKVHDGGADDDGRPFFVMELVEGIPLTQFCDMRRLTLKQRLELFVPVCQAIQHAHHKGVIHRDLKPSNVLVALYDGRPVVKVIDFGVAKATGPALTEESVHTGLGTVVGTLEYMSPEQASLNPLDVDTRSDVYALGVLLYELLAGSPPFGRQELEKAGLLEMLRLIREQEPARPSDRLSAADGLPTLAANRGSEPGRLAALVRGELDWVVLKALEKERSRRYETANAFAADVQRYLADEPVQACPPSAWYRFGKFARRHKGPVLAASLVLLALVVGVIGMTWGLVRAEEQRRAAEVNADRAVQAQERAEQGFAKAREAVEHYLGAVTDDPDLKHKHDLHGLRKKLLDAAMPFYQWFIEQEPGEPGLEAWRGRAYCRLGSVRREIGEKEAAVKDYERGLKILARLATDFPTVPAYRLDLASSHNNLGYLLAGLGQWTSAEQAYRRALEIQEELAAEFPAVPEYRRNLAGSLNNLGLLLKDLGQRLPAEEAHRRALELRAKLAADFPTVPDYRQDLAQSYNNLGALLMELGQRPAAEQAFRGALEIREQLVAEFPAVPSYRGELAESLNGLGVLLHVLGQWPAAEQACQRALEIREKLVADFPSVPQYRRELAGSAVNFGNFLEDQEKPEASLVWFARAIALLAPLVEREPRLITERLFLRNAHLGRATALDRLARHVDAVKDWDRALALCAEPTVKQYLGCARLRSLARAGEHARAVADANALAAGKGVTGGNLYDLAGVCALAAAAVKEDARLQDRYAARAVELLRQAVARGYQDVERLNKDRDLDALRQREDFRRLLAELEAGKPPQRK